MDGGELPIRAEKHSSARRSVARARPTSSLLAASATVSAPARHARTTHRPRERLGTPGRSHRDLPIRAEKHSSARRSVARARPTSSLPAAWPQPPSPRWPAVSARGSTACGHQPHAGINLNRPGAGLRVQLGGAARRWPGAPVGQGHGPSCPRDRVRPRSITSQRQGVARG